jgi:hypothetical protein
MSRPVLALTLSVAALSACTIAPGDPLARGPLAAGAYVEFDSCASLESWVSDNLDRVDTMPPIAMESRSFDAEQVGASGDASSTTNTQEADVDEGDIVDSDGRRLFSVVDGRLRVIDIATGAQLADIALPAGQHQIVLAGNRLLVASERFNSVPTVHIRRYNVAGTPELVDEFLLEGSIAAVRAADGRVRVVLEHRFADRFWGLSDGDRPTLAATDIVPRWAPVEPSGLPGQSKPALECTDVGTPVDFSGLTVTWVAAIDLDAAPGASLDAETAVFANTDAVYATADELLIATHTIGGTDARNSWSGVDWVTPWSSDVTLHRFTTTAGTLRYSASGTVPGHVVGRYALRVKDGYVFVATTVDASEFATVKASRITVLEQAGVTLNELARVDGLGIDEDIKSVRYIGDRAYVVTFRTVDPLYIVDLADPTRPAVLGELKIPGFSTYLHPAGNGLVVGVGYDANDDGRITGAQMSLFDVSDPARPTRLDTIDLGDSTPAADDPHAVTHVASLGLFAVPFARYSQVCSTDTEFGCQDGGITEGVRVVEVDGGRFRLAGDLDVAAVRTVVAAGLIVAVGPYGIVAYDADTLGEQYRIDTGGR